jgi:hypothetical protein
MDKRQLTNAISLEEIREPDVLDGKDCSELALQVLSTLHNSSSGTLRATIESLVCFELTTRFREGLSERLAADPPASVSRLTILGASTMIESLVSFFQLIRLDSDASQHTTTFRPLISPVSVPMSLFPRVEA